MYACVRVFCVCVGLYVCNHQIVPVSEKIWPNCSLFYDTSITFGTHLDFIITKYMDMGPSQMSPLKAFAAIFQDGRCKHIFSYINNCFK